MAARGSLRKHFTNLVSQCVRRKRLLQKVYFLVENAVPMRACYLASNGGGPEPYVFENDQVDTVVTEFLPLKAADGRTVVAAYERLILKLKLAPRSFVPFAKDGGGDYFLVDCSTRNGRIHFFRGDSDDNEKLVDLEVGFAEFCEALKPE